MTNKLHLDLVSQEKRLLTEQVDSINISTSEGVLTILPNHSPLLTQLSEGVMTYIKEGETYYVAIFGGFMDVAPGSKITILADAATRAESIDKAKVEKAKKEAESAISSLDSEQDLAIAENALRRTALELKVAHMHHARKSKKL